MVWQGHAGGRIIRVVAFGTFAVARVAFGGIAALLDPPFRPVRTWKQSLHSVLPPTA